jgi:hypothetical protein
MAIYINLSYVFPSTNKGTTISDFTVTTSDIIILSSNICTTKLAFDSAT